MIELNLGSKFCSGPVSRTLPALGGKMSVSERKRVRHFSETSRWSVNLRTVKRNMNRCLITVNLIWCNKQGPGGVPRCLFFPVFASFSLFNCCTCGLGTAGSMPGPRRLSPTVIYGSSSIVLAVSWTKIIGSRAGGLFRPSPCPLLLFIYKSLALVSILRPHWIIAGKKVSTCRFLGLRGDQGRSSLNPFTFRRF